MSASQGLSQYFLLERYVVLTSDPLRDLCFSVTEQGALVLLGTPRSIVEIQVTGQ